MPSEKEEKPNVSGLLDDTSVKLIGERYGISINPDDITQYRLCQVIAWLEKQNTPSSE